MRIVLLLSIITFTIFTSGCSVFKPTYVFNEVPYLKKHLSDSNLTLDNITNKNGQVCVAEWNGCIDKKPFISIMTYIKDIKSNNLKYEDDINLYNEWALKQNNKNKKAN